MVALRRAAAGAALLLGLASLAMPAAAAGNDIVRLKLTGVIDQVNAAYMEQGIQAAQDRGAVAVLIEIDSPGGELTSMKRILQAILGSRLPVITYVSPQGAQAASAATFITLAGDVAAMAPSTTIGAASVVGSSGEDLPDTLAEKVNNSNAAIIRDLAAAHGRNADWAERAVRSAASSSAADAVAMDPPIVDLVAADDTDLFAQIDRGHRADGRAFDADGKPLPKLSGLAVRDASMNVGQGFLHLLSDPNVAFILFTIGFYGILSELFHPNFFSGPAGGIAIVLAFIGSNSLPLNVGGLLLILLGIGLLVLELTVTSFGLLTVGGVISIVLGAFALWTGVNPEKDAIRISVSPWLLGAVVLLSMVYVFGIVRALLAMRRQPIVPMPITALVGAGGVAQTLIAPKGVAYAGGEAWSARSAGPEIAAGSPVRVVGVDGLELIVEPGSKGEKPA
ncbi:MAG TPA: NfeD family protein [Candidatus Limnocylindria bacterium]|nr:NfeD family protein [Candidatus Limnocylindria bacterium]